MARTLPLLLLSLAACRGPEVEYIQLKPIAGRAEVSCEAPLWWSRTITPTGTADDSWKVEIEHAEDFLVRMSIQKFTLDPAREGYPALTVQEHLEHFRRLQGARLTPVTKRRTPYFEFSRFSVTGDWLQSSGMAPPRVRNSEAFLEKDGFLYTVHYTSPEELHAKYMPIFEHLLDTLRLDPDARL